jgi:glutamyl-tRNA synthetase
LGNARTFLITWAIARRAGWRVVLRIEDLDTPRIKPGVTEATIDTLEWLGLDWDSGPMIQSHDLEPYREAMRRLASRALAYPSDLSRGQVEQAASAPQEGAHDVKFPRELRPELTPMEFDARAGEGWRFAVPDGEAGVVDFVDEFAGPQRIAPAAIVGDFVIWTKREQPSYQLAVVVDDARQGVDQVIRGNDLLDSAARQLLLYRALGAGMGGFAPGTGLVPEPTYTHLPLVRGADGKRLAKRHGDTRLDTYRAKGVTPERVIGLLASWSGILGRGERAPMSAADFARAFDLRTLPREDITFTSEDDAWLLSRR